MDYVEVQFQNSGVWQTSRSCPNDPQIYLCEMKNVKAIYPDLRVRTVDKDGRLLDMLG
jgi:hypothetical protein